MSFSPAVPLLEEDNSGAAKGSTLYLEKQYILFEKATCLLDTLLIVRGEILEVKGQELFHCDSPSGSSTAAITVPYTSNPDKDR